MLIKWGSIVVKGSGKLGGHVFSGGPGGASVHTLAKARNPQTKYQMAIRARFTLLSQGWRDLTESQRESWYGAESEFSRKNRFGDVVLLSGKNLFNALNAQRLIIGLPIEVIAPLPMETASNIIRTIVFDISAPFLFIGGIFTPGAEYIVVATPKVSNGAKSFRGQLRIIGIGVGDNNGNHLNGTISLGKAYIARFGSLALGDNAYAGCYPINNSGQKGQLATSRINVQP